MEEIFAYLEELTYPEIMPPEYRDISKPLAPLYEKVKNVISLDFVDELNTAQADVTLFLRREAFSRGFRLGVQLTLAGIQPFSS